MLYVDPNAFGWGWDNQSTADTPTSTMGVALAASASANTYGSYVNISTSNKDGAGSVTTLAKASHMMDLFVSSVGATGSARAGLINLAFDPAGGTSWSLFAENIACGGSDQGANGHALRIRLPVRIPAGASVGAAYASSFGTAGCRVSAYYYGDPSNPSQLFTGSFCESVGVTVGSVPANCDATAVTPGNSGSWGSWTSLGTCSKRIRYVNLCPQIRNDTQTSLAYYWELGWGSGTTPVRVVMRHLCNTNASERLAHISSPHNACDIPAGATLYARGVCSGTADSGWTVMALGVG